MTDRVARPVCRRCRRPVVVCYCAAITTIETTTKVVILQHPREKDMPIGTARMATLCLPGAQLHVGVEWDGSDVLARVTSDPDRPAILLYPGEGARNVLTDPPQGPVTLVVIDGTWTQAKSIVRDNPGLASLPRYAFDAPAPSEYRIRREPKVEYVSTIEALMHVLGALEGRPERFRSLLEPFRRMVDAHLARHRSARSPRQRNPRPRKAERAIVPEPLLGDPAAIVLVACEPNVWPHGTPEHDLGDELVHCAALRFGTGETLDVVAAPRLPLAAATLPHSGLSEAQLRSGVSPPEVARRLAAFLRPGDVVCAWGFQTPRLLRQCGAADVVWTDLRGTARALGSRQGLTRKHARERPGALAQRGAFARLKVGTLEEYAESLGIGATPGGRGRAAERIARLSAVLTEWRSRGR